MPPGRQANQYREDRIESRIGKLLRIDPDTDREIIRVHRELDHSRKQKIVQTQRPPGLRQEYDAIAARFRKTGPLHVKCGANALNKRPHPAGGDVLALRPNTAERGIDPHGAPVVLQYGDRLLPGRGFAQRLIHAEDLIRKVPGQTTDTPVSQGTGLAPSRAHLRRIQQRRGVNSRIQIGVLQIHKPPEIVCLSLRIK